jgi:hypothetical protein
LDRRVARYLLAILMGLSVLPALVYAVNAKDNLSSVSFYLLYAGNAQASALFFWRSPVLKPHTAWRPKESPPATGGQSRRLPARGAVAHDRRQFIIPPTICIFTTGRGGRTAAAQIVGTSPLHPLCGASIPQ